MRGAEPFACSTQDGHSLAAVRFAPLVPPGPPVRTQAILVAGALGVPQRHYAPFAQWLAARGCHAMTFDLRGMGASLPAGQSVRTVEADMLSWARVDFSATVDALRQWSGAETVTVIGHSLGAHLPAMTTAATQGRIAAVVSVAAGAGYWRDWAVPSRRKAPLMLHLAGPLLTPLFGYFPGKRIGMVADLPAGVMRQWSRWCRHPGFAWGAEPDALAASVEGARYRIHAVSFSDDEAMTQDCTRKLLAAQPNARSSLEVITPQAMGAARIGHLGAFRSEHAARLWPHLHGLATGP